MLLNTGVLLCDTSSISWMSIVLVDLPSYLQFRLYPLDRYSVLVVGTRFFKIRRFTTCFSIRFGVEFTSSYARAVSSVVRALASHARGHWFKSSTAHHHSLS